MMSDPIADMLTRIRNAQMARQLEVAIPFSKAKKAIAQILEKEGYIGGIQEAETPHKALVLSLKYHGKNPAIQAIDRVSKPGHRKYSKAGELPNILNGYGIAIVSTSQGMMTNKDAKKAGVGGEVICSVY